jgi:hypothetical protein
MEKIIEDGIEQKRKKDQRCPNYIIVRNGKTTKAV